MGGGFSSKRQADVKGKANDTETASSQHAATTQPQQTAFIVRKPTKTKLAPKETATASGSGSSGLGKGGSRSSSPMLPTLVSIKPPDGLYHAPIPDTRHSRHFSVDPHTKHMKDILTMVSKKRKATARVSSNHRLGDYDEIVKELPRGGIYVTTKGAGAIQFGLPPETIKDVMCMGLELPNFYIVPPRRFDLEKGLNCAEFEFPSYFNFFIKRRRINLVCNPDAEPLIRTVFTETLLGPQVIEVPDHFSVDVPQDAYPDLSKELAYFRKNPFNRAEDLSIDTLIKFIHFDPATHTAILEGANGNVEIVETTDEYFVYENGALLTKLATDILLHDIVESETELERVSQVEDKLDIERIMVKNYFVPPYFGVTMLGNSDGFDKTGSTTGFVLWLNQRGIMIDPPPYSGAVLKRVGINPRLITGMIVTHCHADHDAGAFQKILEEGLVTLYTTKVICNSFLCKYSAISGLSQEFLKKLFVFRPVTVGEDVHVYGGYLKFFYSLHSIPCVGFEAHHFGQSMIYSADTLNDPPKIQQMADEGFMSQGRANKLIKFPWEQHNVILHESGVPPIHTPLATFETLTEAQKKKLYIVHKNPNTVPLDQGFKPALVGAENSIIISEKKPPNFDAMEILELLGNTDLFKALPFHRGTELVQCAQTEIYKEGQDLIVEGTFGEKLFFIAMGIVSVLVRGEMVKSFSTGDYFGEQSLISKVQSKRSATVRATTDCKVLVLRRNAFHFLVRETDTIIRLKQLGSMQMSESWQVINNNTCLEALTSTQKTSLQSMLQPRKLIKGEVIWRIVHVPTEAILVVQGSLIFAEAETMVPFKRGAFVGEFKAMLTGTNCSTTLVASDNSEIYSVDKEKLLKFLTDNPGLLLRLMPLLFIE